MSATSNKSRMLIILMIVISLVFFITSILAASVYSGPSAAITTNVGSGQETIGDNCVVVRTAERIFADCTLS